jgi:twitching motility protein PilU
MDFKDYLKTMVESDASDLYFSCGAPASAKINGNLTPIEDNPLTAEQIRGIAYSVMNEDQRRDFEDKPEMNLAISEAGIGRFRVNIFRQRNSISLVIRNIKTEIPDWKLLGLPSILTDVIMEKRGLVLFVGATGSGKSTSLASLIDHRNRNDASHIITIEDPIEFVHSHKKSIVNQREVGLDTDCYEDALKNTLRQAPDVILIGEIRDRETMEHALAFAETGHLAISTLHANNSNQALDRIINFFPEDRRNQLLMDLSLNLRAFISQRLVKTIDGKRAAAVEILLGTPLVQDLIRRGDVHEIKEVMHKSENIGMQTFDTALYKLVQEGRVSIDEALKNADSPNNLRLKLNLNGETPVEEQEKPDKSGLSLIDHGENPEDLDEFDAALLKLVEDGKTTMEQALSEADEPDKLRPMLEELMRQQKVEADKAAACTA